MLLLDDVEKCWEEENREYKGKGEEEECVCETEGVQGGVDSLGSPWPSL